MKRKYVANDFIRRARETIASIDFEVRRYPKAKLSKKDREALIWAFHFCGNEYTLLAQFIEGQEDVNFEPL